MGTLIWDDDDAFYHSDLVKIRLKVDTETTGLDDSARLSGTGADAMAFLEETRQLRSARRMDGTSADVGRWPGKLNGATSIRDLVLLPASPADEQAGDPLANLRFLDIDLTKPTKEALAAVASDPGVEYVARVPIRLAAAAPPGADYQSPPRLGTTDNLPQIRWPEARQDPAFQDAHQVSVAVLDSGFDPDHPDLIGQFEKYDWQYKGAARTISDQDKKGHGTHVAGIIGASNTNSFGINGICRCRLKPCKIFKDDIEYTDITNRFEYVVDPALYYIALGVCALSKVHVVNLSIAGFKEDADEKRLIEDLISRGTVIVAAMGNEGSARRTAFPAALPDVIAVGAVSGQDTVLPQSGRGPHIALCAPGEDIWSTHPTYAGEDYIDMDTRHWPARHGPRKVRKTYYQDRSGTSMAAAHVSGAVALLLAKRPGLSVGEVRRALQESAAVLPEMNGRPTDAHGAGRLDLKSLLDWTP